jgi:26S proteasome regulatory subunit N1
VQAHLVDGRASAGASVDSARQNLAATFVNAFVNAGFGQVTVLSLCCVLGLVGIS